MLLPSDWNVPEAFRQRLGEKAGKQRAMEADGHLLLILHKVPSRGQWERGGVLFWRDRSGEWRSTGRGTGVAALRNHIEEFAAAVEQLEEAYEAANDAAGYFAVIQAAGPLHRTAAHMHGALQAAREAVPDSRSLILLRDRAADIDRAAELLHSDASMAMNYAMARRSEELARSTHALTEAGHRLNALAAVFLPLTAVGSLFSMGLHSGLERFAPAIFWVILGGGMLLGLALRSRLVRSAPRAAATTPATAPPIPTSTGRARSGEAATHGPRAAARR